MITFVEKNDVKVKNKESLFTLLLYEEKQSPPEYDVYGMNFSLNIYHPVKNKPDKFIPEEVAYGRCSLQGDTPEERFLYVSGVYVEGNTNDPTKKNPNRFIGLGQMLLFSAIKFGHDQGIKTCNLTPLEGSEGFYLKMGFHPQVKTTTNRMDLKDNLPRSMNGKLNPQWTNRFAKTSFTSDLNVGPEWTADISIVYPHIRSTILRNWNIVEVADPR